MRRGAVKHWALASEDRGPHPTHVFAKKSMKTENRKLGEVGIRAAGATERVDRAGFNEEKREKENESGQDAVRT